MCPLVITASHKYTCRTGRGYNYAAIAPPPSAGCWDLLFRFVNVLYDKSLPVGGDTYTLTLQFIVFAEEGNDSTRVVQMVLVVKAVGNMSPQVSYSVTSNIFLYD